MFDDEKLVSKFAELNSTANGLVLTTVHSTPFICKKVFAEYTLGQYIEVYTKRVFNTATADEIITYTALRTEYIPDPKKWTRECLVNKVEPIDLDDIIANLIEVPSGYTATTMYPL